MLALAGVEADTGLNDTVIETVRSRFSWLAVNLATAILASLVIGLFDAAIGQVVALAILMPIVASMGGNAGTQTLTVVVRSLATKDLTPSNAARIVIREAMVGFLNGVIFAVIMGVLAGVWYYLGRTGRGDPSRHGRRRSDGHQPSGGWACRHSYSHRPSTRRGGPRRFIGGLCYDDHRCARVFRLFGTRRACAVAGGLSLHPVQAASPR